MIALRIGLLFVLLLATFPLGKAKAKAKDSRLRWLPSMRIVRLVIIARMAKVVENDFLHLSDELSIWTGLINTAAISLLVLDLFIDYSWLVMHAVGGARNTPPKIFRELLFLSGCSVIIGYSLYKTGSISGWGTAAGASVLAFVIGPGTSSQLQNLASGLSIQLEKQFVVGDWVEFDGILGQVTSISWSNTTLLDDLADRIIVVANSKIDQAVIINHSKAAPAFKVLAEVGLPYEMRPELASELLVEAVQSHANVLLSMPVDVVLKTFNASSIDYELYFYIRDYSRRHQVLTDVRSRIWYAVQRRGFSIPFPIVDLRPISAERRLAEAELSSQRQECFRALRSLALLAPLSDQELECLALSERVIMYGMGEFIIARNDPDRSMFVLLSGECDVMVGDDKGGGALRQVATLSKGALFGEMSAFTDSPRSACIVAKTPASVLKISQSSIQGIFVRNETALAGIVELIAKREAGLKAFTANQTRDLEESLLAQMGATVRRFLGYGVED
jgi:small-conductance mechanosensitive channel/CRP-like cAMP-binding protein